MSRNTERAANLLFALLLGVLGGLMLVCFLTSCAEGLLC
jgi:hypothetical protein